MPSQVPVIIWFRQDLRLSDNPALLAAHKTGIPILPLYILDDDTPGPWRMGAASRVWLHHSLHLLNESLQGRLVIAKGSPVDILRSVIAQTGARHVFWNRCYEPWRTARDAGIKSALQADQIEVASFNASLLWEPWEIKNQSGSPYKVFTPFFRKGYLPRGVPHPPLPAPASLRLETDIPSGFPSLADLELCPTLPWGDEVISHWHVGEVAALNRLLDFLEQKLAGYKEGRDFPAQEQISRLSPSLHFGEISPRQIWYEALACAQTQHTPQNDLEHFLAELGWREFSYHLLYHFPDLPQRNFQEKFDAFPWQTLPEKDLDQWRHGRTGYPIVDAAMRELWQTGFMHNRCRMIVGSFLVKHLLCDWQIGARWFWDCLFDADLASNSASWQWIAGSGADAAPYFRIFNPITQGEKFDPTGTYIRRYVPELSQLPLRYLFAPWEAPPSVLSNAGITLGKTYPHPMVDHNAARIRALKAFESLKNTA
ncbi:MAG: deoxyribodipyrimidine photo-lyase [Rhodospirillales bacterium]|nr:deoxyribodipyrimidine photo-lyase [Rhodospirillales bacterium]MCB9980645.1 deoxyribodipyrimidine photo-lyase [Rhodospirillales bacterium]